MTTSLKTYEKIWGEVLFVAKRLLGGRPKSGSTREPCPSWYSAVSQVLWLNAIIWEEVFSLLLLILLCAPWAAPDQLSAAWDLLLDPRGCASQDLIQTPPSSGDLIQPQPWVWRLNVANYVGAIINYIWPIQIIRIQCKYIFVNVHAFENRQSFSNMNHFLVATCIAICSCVGACMYAFAKGFLANIQLIGPP